HRGGVSCRRAGALASCDGQPPSTTSEGRQGARELNERAKEPVTLDIHQILSILPHRYPFVMVDRVTEIISGKTIRGPKCVHFNELGFPGHSPQRPIMPGVLILECLAQIGGILAYASEPFDPTTNLMFFLGIDKAKFRHTVTPGDRLDLFCEVIHHRS